VQLAVDSLGTSTADPTTEGTIEARQIIDERRNPLDMMIDIGTVLFVELF